MTDLLIDPKLLEPPGPQGRPLPPDSSFWASVVGWAFDVRAKLGSESHGLVCAQYAEHGYPTDDLQFAPGALRHDYQAALGRLLSRVLIPASDPEAVAFDPCYLGSTDQELALQIDITGTSGTGVLGLATSPTHWAREAVQVTMEPPRPAGLALCMRPGELLPEELALSVISFYEERRVHIVGARPEAQIMERIRCVTGLAESEIRWLPCERARPPRNLDARWSGLDSNRDVTVCITGRVGHSTSEKAAKAAEKACVPHLLVELPSQVAEVLRQYGIARSQRLG